jgi:hypothetical protein
MEVITAVRDRDYNEAMTMPELTPFIKKTASMTMTAFMNHDDFLDSGISSARPRDGISKYNY